MAEIKSLYDKILAVMETVERIPKNGTNTHFNYKYVMESDVKDAVRNAMIKEKLVMVPVSIQSQPPQTIGSKGRLLTMVKLKCRLINVENQTEYIDIEMDGQGVDSEDKGIYKAITGAIKYLHTTTYQIPTGDDPEKTDKPEPQENQQNAKLNKEVERIRGLIKSVIDRTLEKAEVITAINQSKILTDVMKKMAVSDLNKAVPDQTDDDLPF